MQWWKNGKICFHGEKMRKTVFGIWPSAQCFILFGFGQEFSFRCIPILFIHKPNMYSNYLKNAALSNEPILLMQSTLSVMFGKQLLTLCNPWHRIRTRLAAIDGVGGDTGVKPQHRLRHLHRPSPSFDFFYSNKNHLVQLEDTTIKTERGCSMQHTERTTVAHHRSDFIYSHVRRVSRAGVHFPKASLANYGR